MTKTFDLESMPIDDLWKRYEEVNRELDEKLTTEKRKVEDRLNQLRGGVARPTRQAGRWAEVSEPQQSGADLVGPRENAPLGEKEPCERQKP